MKKVGKAGLQIGLALVLALSGILSSANIVSAEEPVNEVDIYFHTRYSHSVNEDSFDNSPVIGEKYWAVGGSNYEDETGLPITDMSIELESALQFERFNSEPTVIGPPVYQWNLGDIPEGGKLGTSVRFAEINEISYTPGFDVSRSMDKTIFTGEDTQTITVTATPRQEINTLFMSVEAKEDENVVPTIISPLPGTPGYTFWNDGQKVQMRIENPVQDTPYELTVTLQIVPKVPEIEFVPNATVLWNEPIVARSTITGSSFSHTVPEIGTWTANATGTYQWGFKEQLTRQIALHDYSREIEENVLASFQTTLIYSPPGSDFINDEVLGNRAWNTFIENHLYKTGGMVTNYTLNLDSGLVFDSVYPPPDTMGPPTYSWSLGDRPVGTRTAVNLGFNQYDPLSDPFPVWFTPGFDASRTVDVVEFTESGTQFLTITVTPREVKDTINIRINLWPDPIVNTAFSAVDGPEGCSVFQAGSMVSIQQKAPVVGNTYVYTVTIEVTPTVPKIEFIPSVQITDFPDPTPIYPAVTSSFITHEIDGLGTWTMNAGEEHTWIAQEGENKAVRFYSGVEELMGSISGIVLTDTGTPINGAGIVAFRDAGGLGGVTWSGEDGSYLLENLPIGDYYVRVTAPNNISQWYDSEDFLANRDMVTVALSEVPGINFSLKPDPGSMSGYVYEADGVTPVYRAFVDMYTYDGAAWILAYRTLSQLDGSYALPSSMPGDYKVKAEKAGYLEEWYQESFSEVDATLVTIATLAETSGIDFSLSRQYETPAGDNILVDDIYNEVSLEFTEVAVDGSTSVNVAEDDPSDGTSEFRVVGKYYDISTDALYDGPITITLTYDDTDLNLNQELNLEIWHWEGTHWTKVNSIVDTDNNTIAATVDSLSWFVVGEPNEPPIAEAAVTTYLEPVDSEFTFDGSNSIDPDGSIVSYEWDFGDESSDNGISVTHSYTTPGLYNVVLTVTDDTGAQSTVTVLVVVYDPDAGFATGGGWFIPGKPGNSDPGDILPGLDGSSKATFGFVVKYKNGVSTTPSGQLEFKYRVGDFNLHSGDYDWLVVTNTNWAKFQGLATISGSEELYPFRVEARDGDESQLDKFIIKIWAPNADPDADELIYKASGELGGGNIVIHK
ncbi:PKD domain-containing protein [Chloroflexota bacterium]